MRKQVRSNRFDASKSKNKIYKHPWYDGSFGCMMLLFVCIVQALLIVYLWQSSRHNKDTYPNVIMSDEPKIVADVSLAVEPIRPSEIVTKSDQWQGVAACLLLGQPEWFQRRYTSMVRNVRDNIPASWGIQVFYIDDPQTKHGFEINRGLQRMNESGLISLTLIPREISKVKRRPKEMWTDRWLWANMKSNRVLVFGGNAVMCGNSPFTVNTFSNWDYVGSPWDYYKRTGGDGGISLRNKDAMLKVIDFELERTPVAQRGTAYKEWGMDDQFFVSRMVEMNKLKLASFQLGSRDATLMFGAIGSWANSSVLAVSGTLGTVPLADREKFFNYCPELKAIFPALHDPHCFGASSVLDKDLCAASICALQDRSLHRGGC